MSKQAYRIVVIGSSAGGLEALRDLLSPLDKSFCLPIVVVQHIAPGSSESFIEFLQRNLTINLKEADDKEELKAATVYIAPPDYHLLIEKDMTLALSVDEKVLYSRPSINILFESAASVLGPAVIAVLLTGANNDGAAGMVKIRKSGGLAIIQSPDTAYCGTMPAAAIAAAGADYILSLEDIPNILNELTGAKDEH